MRTDYRDVWPTNWTQNKEEQLEHYKRVYKQYRQLAERERFCDDQSLRLACKEAKLLREQVERAHAALRRIMFYANEKGNHELHVMAVQGLPIPITK